MKINFRRTLVASLVLSMVPLATIAPSVGAWDAKVKQCEFPGQSSQVFNGERGYEMLLFQDGMQPRYTFGYGWHDVDKGGEYLVRWAKDGEFHPDTDTVTVKECPPEKPEPELSYELSCVSWREGSPRNAILWESSWDSHGRDLIYIQNVKIYNDPRSLKDWRVRKINFTTEEDKGTLSKTKFVGSGTFHVEVVVEFGHKKVEFDRDIKCTDLVFAPKARFGNTRGDPWETGRVSNRMNVTAQKVIWSFVGRNGPTHKKVNIPGRCAWSYGWNWVQGGSTMTIKWIRPNGNRVVIAEKQVPPPGYYGKVPSKYRGYICP